MTTKTKMRVELKAEIDVVFSEPEKAVAVFIDGDWKDAFWPIDDIEDLATNIARAFHHERDQFKYDDKINKGWNIRYPEGFGTFVQQGDDTYVMEDESTGKIIVSYEMELDGTYEIND